MFDLRRIVVSDIKQPFEVNVAPGLYLTTKQQNWIRNHAEFYDQVNGAHWISLKELRFCAFLLPAESPRDDMFDLQELVEEL